jgi:hypothetical protein
MSLLGVVLCPDVEGEAVVSVEVEGDVVDVPAALPLIEPLCPLCAAELAAPAG